MKRTSLAHCLVKYRTKSGLEERVWNSLPWEPPRQLIEKTTGEMAYIVEDESYEHRPDYVPELGERIFVRMDESAMRRHAEFVVDDPLMPPDVSEEFTNQFKTRVEALDFVASVFAERDCVDTVYVTSAIQEQIKREHADGRSDERELDIEGSQEAMMLLALGMIVDPTIREKVRRVVNNIEYRDRNGLRVSAQKFAELRKTEGYVMLADTHISHGFHVITAWIGLDKENRKPARIFRTAFMRRKNLGDEHLTPFVKRSYATEAEAFRGHAELVREARESVQDQLD